MQRRQARQEWFQAVRCTIEEADLMFLEPDNGLQPAGFSHDLPKAGKSITLDEPRALARPERCLIVYHHQTRRKGGHHGEIENWADRLRACGSPLSMHCEPDSIRPGFSSWSMRRLTFANGLSRSPWTGGDGLRGILVGQRQVVAPWTQGQENRLRRPSWIAYQSFRPDRLTRVCPRYRARRGLVGRRPAPPPRSATSTETARRSYVRPARPAPIMANTSMCCVATPVDTSTAQTARTSGRDGARPTIAGNRVSLSDANCTLAC